MEKLTFTRFAAAMSVVLTHFGQDIPVIDTVPWSYFLRQGSSMVSYFFVLSGFIMATVYWELEGRADRRAYWAARFARIYPVYILALVFMMALGGPEKGSHPGWTFVLNATMIQAWLPTFAVTGNPPGWSLSAEAFFYLAFPFCLPLLRGSRGVWRPFVVVGLVWLVSQVGHHVGRQALELHFVESLHNAIHYDPLLHFNSFLVGAFASLMLRRRGGQRTGAARPGETGASLAMVLASVALVAAALLMLGRGVYVAGAFLSATNGLLAPIFALFIAALSVDTSPWTRWLAWWPLVALGEMSYAVYMLQDPMRELVYRLVSRSSLNVPPVPLFWMFVLALLAVSAAVWRWYERPLRRFLRQRLGGNSQPQNRRSAMV
ncbi:MAG: acyltransferase [Betaproteobacteria bacterium]